MMKTLQVGDSRSRTPGTCKQTGNHAPNFPWSSSPIGRVARIAALLCAYRLGYDDDLMAKSHVFPPAQDIYDLFVRLLPWFGEHFNEVRKEKVERTGYIGPLKEFDAFKVENRVRYCFAKPGKTLKSSKKPRYYGISTEHPMSVSQRTPRKLGTVFVRCSEEITRRLESRTTISKAEATIWGTLV